MLFKLELPAGNYKVKVSALGVEYESQLGVGKAEGKPYVYELDLNADGVNEYRMENDSVQVTLLATGARVIEYIVKSRDDNVLFKLWPEKAIDDKRPFRKRGYYPYGGFEDFLGQGSMETHQVYDAEIVQKEGDYVRVRMWTDYYGNRLEKTFTLYGDYPLLEVRFALTFKNPEANVLGPQPILELGQKHWTEDVFIVPELDGLQEYRMKPEKYYGRVQHLKEGWNAGYDTKEDITFIGAYPVDQPLFLHMWMNHPSNSGGTSLLCGIPAMDTHLSEKHHVFYLLYMGCRRTLGKRGKRTEGNESDYHEIIQKVKYDERIRCFYQPYSLLSLSGSRASGQKLDDFKYQGTTDSVHYMVNDGIQFNGYTNYWHNTYHKWIRTGNLFKMAVDNVEHVILQSKVDIAEEMGLPGLIMQEGFLNGLTSDPYQDTGPTHQSGT